MNFNCVIIDDDTPCQRITEEFIRKTSGLNLLHTFSSPIEALNIINKSNVPIDILFVDIEMPDMNGIELIQSLQNKIKAIILTTSHKDFATEAFENHVLDYLVKPLTYPRFYKAIQKVQELINIPPLQHEDVLFIKEGSQRIKINGPDIIYLKAEGDYVSIYTQSNTHTIYATLTAIEEKLFPHAYARAHRSYIVRIDKIQAIDDMAISLKDTSIPIGPKYKDALYKQLNMI